MNVRFFPLVPRRDWKLVSQNLGVRFTDDTNGIIAADVDSNLVVGACILQMWTRSSVFAHLWIDNSMVLRHGFFEEIANYVFNTTERDVIIGMVPSDNEGSLKLCKHLGMKEVHRVTGGFMYDIDWVMLEGRRDDLARWLAPKNEVEAA